MTKYYINGFAEGKSYFFDLLNGRINAEQLAKLQSGEPVELNGNIFQIVKTEQAFILMLKNPHIDN